MKAGDGGAPRAARPSPAAAPRAELPTTTRPIRARVGSELGAVLLASAAELPGGVAELARELGVGRTTLYEIIAGRRAPSASALVAISEFLNVPAATVLAWCRAPV